MNRELSSEMAKLWHKADKLGVARIYANLTRNPEKSVRDNYKINVTIEGSFEWAIDKCMSLTNSDYTDMGCAAISAALDARK
jgi:hypothetical protein